MSNFEERYKKLNERQREAVDAIEGPVMVIAGPGSGKTELLGLRIANILRLTDAQAEDILCLTFTEAAARNMRERLAGLIGKDAYRVAVHTFHSFGLEIINRHPEFFYQGASPKPIDEISQVEIIEDIIKDLKWDSRLKSYNPDQGVYTYLSSIRGCIEDLKKGALTPDEFEELISENRSFEEEANRLVGRIFTARISAAMLPDLVQLSADLAAIQIPLREHPLPQYRPLRDAMLESLAEVIRQAQEAQEKRNVTKPITSWKRRYLKKGASGDWRLASSFHSKELLDLAKVYREYQSRLRKQGFYDFADMILDTVEEMERSAELRYELSEKFLYVLVDEFQDTSAAQMRLLDAVVDAEANEGKPNLLVVGDDDQSIYKFQGASMQTFDNFLGRYREVKKVVLTHNYRSTQLILDYSQGVIERADNRLSDKDGSIVKELIAAGDHDGDGIIVQREFMTRLEECIFIAEEIKKIKADDPGKKVAVIGRKHGDLVKMALILDYYGVPTAYERNKNLLEEKHIREIIALARFADSLNSRTKEQADEYLPEILAFPFLGLERIDIWKVSTIAHQSRSKNWLEAMTGYGGKMSEVARFLIALGTEARRRTMEEFLDLLTGVDQIDGVAYKSGFKEYYFSEEKFEEGQLRYLEYLFDLKTLFGKLREYRSRETLYLNDLIDFLDLHAKHNLPIYKSQRLSRGKEPIALLTAHNAKGSEFDTVFILSCNENSWMKDGGSNKLPFPANIPLSAEKDDISDKVRLFFVAVTRAKTCLYLTNHSVEDGEKRNSERLRFLDADLETSEIEALETETIRSAQEAVAFDEELRRYAGKSADEEDLLRSLLEGYALSVTHLNNFLDVTSGGPADFLENSLLHFPSAKSPAASYGTAIHDSLREFYKRFKEDSVLPARSELLDIFEKSLGAQGLNQKDFTQKLERGKEELGRYFDGNAGSFDARDLVEADFRSEGVMIGDCPITGKIDRMSLVDEKEKLFKVYDYKTGKPFSSWSPGEDRLKVHACKYRNQLIFYKLLVENSRSFHKFRVESGGIDFITALDEKLVRLDLDMTDAEVERMKALIGIVYAKIMALDFPDISSYPASAKGMAQFEEDLLAGKI